MRFIVEFWLRWDRIRLWLWRTFLIAVGARRLTPSPWGKKPGQYSTGVAAILDGDTGGGLYRPAHVEQDPAVDPAEPTDESSSTGNDHGWSNCTMAAGAMALDYHTQGRLKKHGGHLRHKQGDLSGGTDLYDLRDAWGAYGETLSIRSGGGWAKVKDDRADGRMLVMQGSGNVPGSATFDGGHACAVSPETHSDGRWLFGDPLATDWQWVSESSIRTWAEHWQGSIAYAASAAFPASSSTPPPPTVVEPDCPPEVDPTPFIQDGYDAGSQAALDDVFRQWQPGHTVPTPEIENPWGAAIWGAAKWELWPYPLVNLMRAVAPATWNEAGWTASVWEVEEVPPEPLAAAVWAVGWGQAVFDS